MQIIWILCDLHRGKANKWELIPALMTVYSQYKSIKTLIQFFQDRDEKKVKEDKDEIDGDISRLEPFLESALYVGYETAFGILYIFSYFSYLIYL